MADLIAKVEAACNAHMSARNPLQKAELEKCCKVLKKEKRGLPIIVCMHAGWIQCVSSCRS